MTIKGYISDFIHHLRFHRRLSEHTVTAYGNDLKQFRHYVAEQYGIDQLSDVKNVFIRSWIAELKGMEIKDRSLRRKASALQSFFKYLLTRGVIQSNPAQKIVLPKIAKPLPQFLETKQTESLTDSSLFPDTFEGNTEKLIIGLLYKTGVRRAELIGIKEGDVNFQRGELWVTGKGNKQRILPLDKDMLFEIEQYVKLKKKIFENPSKYLLSLKSGKQLYDNYVYRVVKKYLKMVTTISKKSPHLLRHTFATQLLNNGADLMAIKDLLGHSSLASTQIYTSVNIDQLKEIHRKAHPKS